jgi:hypothetical protein
VTNEWFSWFLGSLLKWTDSKARNRKIFLCVTSFDGKKRGYIRFPLEISARNIHAQFVAQARKTGVRRTNCRLQDPVGKTRRRRGACPPLTQQAE